MTQQKEKDGQLCTFHLYNKHFLWTHLKRDKDKDKSAAAAEKWGMK